MFQPSCPHYLACPRNRKGVYADKKRHLFLKMEPKSATDIMAIVASVVEIAIFVWDMLLKGGVVRPFHASRLFLFFFFFLIHLAPSKVTLGETIAYCRDSSWPWGEWGENSLSYMKYLVTDQPA